MGAVRIAKQRIKEAKDTGATVLYLDSLNLTSQELTSLMPSIAEISQLKELDLADNLLHTLPDTLFHLNALESLNLEANEIINLSESLRGLQNLKTIFLKENSINNFPSVLMELPHLEYADLRTNEIEDIPRTITDLGELIIDLSDNPLTQETRTWITTTFREGVIATDNSAHDTEQDITEIMNALYPETAEEITERIEDINFGSFSTATKSNRGAHEILMEFLSKTSYTDPVATAVYLPTTKEMLDFVLNPNNSIEDRSIELQKMATSLGDCPTPVTSFLIQTAISKQIKENGTLPEFLEKLLIREAVEAEVASKLKTIISESQAEKIELMQAFNNSLFSDDAEINPLNKIKIEGERPRLPSKTENFIVSYGLVTEPLAVAFAKICCKTDDNKQLTVTNEGNYVLAPEKLRSITSGYRAKLGIITDQEKEVMKLEENYEKEITAVLKQTNLMEYPTEKKVVPLIDILTQKEDLRIALFNVEETAFEETYQGFLEAKKEAISKVAEEFAEKEEKSLAGMKVPLNQTRDRSPSPDGGKRKANLSLEESSNNKRSRSPGSS